MATDYQRPPAARTPLYNASSAGWFIGSAILLAIIWIGSVTLS